MDGFTAMGLDQMTDALRIGLFTPAWPGHNTPNGIATAVYNLAIGLREIGHVPVIIPMKHDGERPDDIPVVPVPMPSSNFWDRLRIRFGSFDAANDPFVRSMVDAVRMAMRIHGMNLLIMEESLGWARRIEAKTDLPVVMALHGPTALLQQHYRPGDEVPEYQRYKERLEAEAFAAAPALISPSRHVLDGVAGLADIADTPQVVIANSFRAPTPDPLPATLAPRKILFVGRFDYLKGGDVLFEAMAHLVTRYPQAELTFAGPDNGLDRPDGTRQSIHDVIAALPEAAQAQITYFGPASRDQVAQLRESHAIALIASRYENLNYSLLEAMAAGQAIVSTAVGGPSEVLVEGETALLVPPADSEAMAAALGCLLEDAVLTETLGRNAVAAVKRDFDPAVIAERTLEFVSNVVKST